MILRKFCFIFALIFSISLSFSSSVFATPSYTYTGSSTLINDGSSKYRIKLLTSGTFTPNQNMIIDVFLVGGGGSGRTWGGSCGGSGGGGGGYTTTALGISITAGTTYSITIGAGGNGGSGGTTTGFNKSAAGGVGGGASNNGGNGGSGGGAHVHKGGTDGSNGANWDTCATGGTGQGTTTREFGDPTGTLYSTGGDGNPGGCDYASGAANTGNGGMGAWWECNLYGYGGSGIVVVRLTEDTVPPSGGSISYSATTIASSIQSLSATVNDGTDALSGVKTSTRQLLRQEATLTSGTCGSYGAASSVSYSGTYPNITTTNFEANRCYKYQWSVSDNAGNNVIYSSSTVVTSSAGVIGIKDVTLGSFVSINGLNFIKVNSTGLLVAAAEYATDFTQTFSYTGAAQTFTVPYSGWYQIETWGAQSGNTSTSYGAYATGKLYMSKGETYYIYIGGQGNGGCVAGTGGGYNGGGNSGSSGCSRGGGGATDIRLVGGLWNDASGLSSRIMVAGGGGAGENNVGGYGGTLIGGPNNASAYATQTSGSAFGYAATPTIDSSGAGGGYYGGSLATADGVAAGGGSSFISGYAGVNAITSVSSLTPTNNTLHYSGKYFIDGKMQSGVRSGNGQAIITLIPAPTRLNTNLNNVRYIKDCVNGNSTDITASWVEVQAIVNGVNVAKGKTVTGTVAQNSSYPYSRIVDGDITTANYAMASANNSQCITIDLGQVYNLDEVGIWHYWGDGRTVYSNTTSASADNSNWVTLISTAESETVNGKRVNAYAKDFFYTGGAQTFTVPQSGWYQIETWGAAGGSAWTSAGGLGYCSGGAGAYSKGKIYLISGETLYVYVGGKGSNASGGSQLAAAGYNGGGGGGNGGSDDSSGSGGGATDVRLVSGVWNDATSLKSRIMIAAGGGGGSCINASYTDMTYRNGAALINSSISVAAWNQVCAVPEINQKSGYSFGIGRSGWNNTNANTHGLGGGGGGYYGGNGCRNTATEDYWSGGSGGTSFISGHVGCIAITSASDLTPKCATGSDVACASHYSGKVFTNTSITSGVRTGDGYARISFVE